MMTKMLQHRGVRCENHDGEYSGILNTIFFSSYIFLNMVKLILYSSISPSTSKKVANKDETTIRTKRLMKEYKEIQRVQFAKEEPQFTVSCRLNETLFT